MKTKKLISVLVVVLVAAVAVACAIWAVSKQKKADASGKKKLSVSGDIIDSLNTGAAGNSQLTAKIDSVLALDSSEKRIESIKELSLSEGLEIAPYLGEDVKDYYRGIFEKHSVGEIKKQLNESDSEKIDNFFGRFMFGGDGGDFLPHQFFGCPGLLTKLFGLQPEDQHALTLEDVIELMKEIRAESGSNNEGNEPFALDDAVLWKKIRERYNIQPDEVGGSGLGYETYFLDDDYSEVLLTRPGLVAVLKYDYEGSNVRVSDWWDSGSGLTPETVFPYADTSECAVFTLD